MSDPGSVEASQTDPTIPGESAEFKEDGKPAGWLTGLWGEVLIETHHLHTPHAALAVRASGKYYTAPDTLQLNVRCCGSPN